VFHRDAEADLKAIREREPLSAGRLLAALEQAKADPDLMDRLTQHDYGVAGTADFHVSRWESQQYKYKRNLWRLKLWDLENQGIRYRVIYAFEPASHSVFVLGVTARRTFNYEDNDAFTRRVVGCYDRYFPRS
jgi:hypothetical protein